MKKINVLDPSYTLWRRLQEGQEKVIRWSKYHQRFPDKLRRQNGHEHCCSVGFIFDYLLIKLRPYVKLDELLILRCVKLHDVQEGITLVDTPAPQKQSLDDCAEYLVFEEHFRPLGEEVWRELQRCFLLQFALDDNQCFPEEAKEVMKGIKKQNYLEALFFDGAQRLDYLYYAYECLVERGMGIVLKEVFHNQCDKLESVAQGLPGFGEVIWTRSLKARLRALIE